MNDRARTTLIALAAALVLPCATAEAQTHVATGSLTIERALTVNTVRPMAFGAVGGQVDPFSTSMASEAIIEVTGDPGRLYRITLPASIAADQMGSTVDSFTLRSQNSGDITHTLTAHMNALGTDRLHIGGRLRGAHGMQIVGVKAVVPLTIDYE